MILVTYKSDAHPAWSLPQQNVRVRVYCRRQRKLAGILYHLALVEESWLEGRFLGLPERDDWKNVDWKNDPDWEFRTATTMDPAELRTRYEAACERSREAAAAQAESLDQLSAFKGQDGWQFTLRWVHLTCR